MQLLRKEGKLTRTIEKQTAKVPSMTFLGVAGASAVISLVSLLKGRTQLATFIGQWVPTVLLLGIYNKLVKEMT